MFVREKNEYRKLSIFFFQKDFGQTLLFFKIVIVIEVVIHLFDFGNYYHIILSRCLVCIFVYLNFFNILNFQSLITGYFNLNEILTNYFVNSFF